jgi:hypothetical protein
MYTCRRAAIDTKIAPMMRSAGFMGASVPDERS